MFPYRSITTALLFLPCLVSAGAPSYEVLQQIGGLAVNYDVEAADYRTILHVTNHENFAILCDASMTTNKQERDRSAETLVAPDKTISFRFKHRGSVDSIKIYLVCEPADKSASNDKPAAATTPKEHDGERPLNEHLAPAAASKPVVVPVEDLGTP